MKITNQDIAQVPSISEISEKLDRIDEKYMIHESDLIVEHQPFFMSLIIGYSIDFKPTELEEIMKLILMIWEYFKVEHKFSYKKVTENQFERAQKRNIDLLAYIEGEIREKEKMSVMSSDLGHLKSKALLTGILFRINTKDGFKTVSQTNREIILIGMKSLIECMEENKI
jgi:hypothetical protein